MKFRDSESESWSSEDSDEDEVEQDNELSEVNSSEKEEEEDISDEEDSSEQSFSVGAVGKFPTKPIGGEIICFVPLLYIPGRGDLFMPPEPRDNIICYLSNRDQCAMACVNREGERVIESFRKFALSESWLAEGWFIQAHCKYVLFIKSCNSQFICLIISLLKTTRT